ncbi:MAG: hypothetical protein IJ418_07230 [Clostridia bacterium]|nr:hypothetical protein [Clostridia bacterium]
MMEYKKPEFFVTEFVPNEAVTMCISESEPTATQQPKDVHCIIDGEDTIFYSNCSGRPNFGIDVSEDEGYLFWNMDFDNDPDQIWSTTIDGKTYKDGDNFFMWETGRNSGSGYEQERSLIEKFIDVLENKGYDLGWKDNWYNWHLGVFTPSMHDVKNQS